MSPTDLSTEEINNKVQLACKRYFSLNKIMKTLNYHLQLNKRSSTILPIVTYDP